MGPTSLTNDMCCIQVIHGCYCIIMIWINRKWKVSLKLCLCLIKNHALTYRKIEVLLHAFWTSALGDKMPNSSHPTQFPPGKQLLIPTGWGWVGPRASLEDVINRKNYYTTITGLSQHLI
jgi:hypothetical protein